ncbi:MAG: hypothetical protein GF349_04105 [Candidatus Magasanikbacteria bacterium]|nr:hypothetical protein [Candidatus Magasanikbacteria bacterium]
MPAKLKLEQFDGPYDLLLSLVEERELNISELALSQVTEQFLEYMDTLTGEKAQQLADFLVVATKLLYLKSKMLLPQFSPEDEEADSLEKQLKLYKQFIEASKKINNLWLDGRLGYFRTEPPRVINEFVKPKNFSGKNFYISMSKLINRIKPPKKLPSTHIDKAVSMKEKIDHIRDLLNKKGSCSFFDISGRGKNKTELIIGFLALLELVKQKSIKYNQENLFSDISIEKV